MIAVTRRMMAYQKLEKEMPGKVGSQWMKTERAKDPKYGGIA